jgi:hypothetical protein
MQSIDPNGRLARGNRAPFVRIALALVAVAILAVSVATGASAMGSPSSGSSMAKVKSHGKKHHKKSKKHKKKKKRATQGPAQPVQAVVLTPSPGDTTGNDFNVDVSLQARNALGNSLLSNYTNGFLDPTGPDGQGNPAFHPGHSSFAPGLVVTLSTTPSIQGTPLVGPSTNLAGVFQINSVTQNNGRTSTWNDWQVSSPGFFGTNTPATLTVYAVQGQAPDMVPAGGLTPISNVVQETYQIGS